MSDTRRSAPDDAFFWDGAAVDRLADPALHRLRPVASPAGAHVRACGSLAWDTAEASGRGRIVSWMYSLHPNRPDDEPRIVILVQLEEGTRLVSNLVDPPDDGPYDDRPVVVEFRDDRGTSTPFFRVGDVTGATASPGIGATEFSKDSGPQHDAARRRSVPRRHPRRRPDARPTSTAWSRSPSTATTSSSSCATSASRRSPGGRARPAGAWARAPPCSTRSRR